MYVARYAWELGGALVFVVAATSVNRLPTRTSCYFEPDCIQFFCICSSPSTAHPLPPTRERRGKKRFPFGILGDTLHPSKEIGNGDLLLALFARRRSQPKVIATSSRGHGPSHSHFLLLSILSILVSFC